MMLAELEKKPQTLPTGAYMSSIAFHARSQRLTKGPSIQALVIDSPEDGPVVSRGRRGSRRQYQYQYQCQYQYQYQYDYYYYYSYYDDDYDYDYYDYYDYHYYDYDYYSYY